MSCKRQQYASAYQVFSGLGANLPFDKLHDALMALPHTGSRGFEGFVRDALAELTGQGFRLMKSGPQGGVDMIGDVNGSGLVIGMEGKQYAAKTRLPLDGLKAKLYDASLSFPAMDIWLLATTRPMGGGDVAALGAVGANLGVDVVVFDWDDDKVTPPSLATLCAAAPAASAHHLGKAAASDIAAVRANAFFAAEAARIRDALRAASIGLAAARSALSDWLRAHMRDAASARTAFDSYATLAAPDAGLIARLTITAQLDAWWQSGPTTAMAMLGQEGRGKTWAALSWWLDKSAADPDFPLTFVVPARDVASSDGPLLLATALHDATGLRDVAYWQKRLERWAHLDTPQPLILLIIDGLNQNWSFTSWSDLLVSLDVPQWRGKVALMLTCRPDHWASRLKALEDSTVRISTVSIGSFDDAEMDAVLATHGVKREELTPQLQALIRVPRLSRIAIERRDALSSGEITPERLVYEDWRHRHPSARQALSHSEFQAFVSGLGRQLDEKLDAVHSRAELLDRLDSGGGQPPHTFQGVLSEMIDGDWLQPGPEPNQFKLNMERVPAALGLALVDDLRRAATEAAREEVFAARLDPLQGSDVAVAILNNASTFALLDPKIDDALRLMLLDRWTKSQNFSPRDFASFWGLMAVNPELFLDLAEDDWFEQRGGSREDEIVVKGFANAFKWNDVAGALEKRLVGWFSRYWLDPLEGEILGQVIDDDNAATRRAGTAARATAAKKEGVAAAFGLKLVQVEPKLQAWGSWRAVELLSWLPRAPLIKVYTAWAITRAVLGGNRQFDALAWVLRWNEEDPEPAEVAILERADALLGAGGAIARDAAKSLLEALASPAARAKLDAAFGAPMAALTPSVPTWSDVPDIKRFQEKPLGAAAYLDADPRDPNVTLPPDMVERLVALANAMPDSALVGDGYTDKAAEAGALALARWAPHALGDLLRRGAAIAAAASHVEQRPGRLKRFLNRVRRVDAGPGGKIIGAAHLPAALPVLSADDLAPWRALSERAREQQFDAGFDLHCAALADAPASEQIKLLRALSPCVVQEQSARLLAEPTQADFDAVAAELDPAKPTNVLLAWLDWLDKIPENSLPRGWPPLAALVSHPEASVRAAVFELIWGNHDEVLADALEQSGWRFLGGMHRNEAAWGTLAMTLSSAAADGNMHHRIHADGFGELAERYPHIQTYRNAFADHVFSEIEHLQTAKSRKYPRALLNGFSGWDGLLEEHGPALIAWVYPFTHAERSGAHWFMHEPFPYLRALEAAERIAPGSLARAVTASLKHFAASNFRSGDLYAYATKVPGPMGEEARQLALAEANDDQKLFDFAHGLQEEKDGEDQTEWLLGQIQRDLGSKTIGIIARGITLAGYLLPGERADKFWTEELSSPSATGWLTEVHAAALHNYNKCRWAQHWNAAFQQATDMDVAHGAWELLHASLDERLFLGKQRPSSETLDSWPWRKRHQWRFGWSLVQATIKKRKEALAKLFLSTDPPLSNQWPRRR